MLRSCTVCPKDCGNDRLNDEIAACYSGRLPIVSSYTAHFGEEPCLSGTHGAGNIFFGNCNLRCVYCQNYQISQTWKEQKKNEVTHERLADMMLELQARGCHNIGFVSPTHFAPQMARAIFIAAEPRMYERGVAWMLPLAEREHFYGTAEKIGRTLRRLMAGRLLGMAVEGFGTWILLSLGGVPMAALLGILTGLLAFLPNIGAIISGALIILVGFSAGVDVGLYAVFVYFVVQMVDGYLIVPMVAKRAVDLAPALVLGAQILFGALFGILGLALADPIIAMIKVALERQSERNEARAIRKGP